MGKCLSCSKEVIWAKTLQGKRMPVDATPAARGNVALFDEEGATIAVVLGRDGRSPDPKRQPSPDAPRYTSHFATCPHAAFHRK